MYVHIRYAAGMEFAEIIQLYCMYDLQYSVPVGIPSLPRTSTVYNCTDPQYSVPDYGTGTGAGTAAALLLCIVQ